MAERTGIEWCHHTFNPWWGCTRVSAGCTRCYAETLSKRFGYKVWGQRAERRTFGEKHWNEPRRWNRKAERDGERRRVFCGSMCDWAEDHPTATDERWQLWGLIRETPALDWLLLTKRPERLPEVLPRDWGDGYPNVWLLTTVEHAATLWRVRALCQVPAVVRGLSIEPLIGPISSRHLQISTPCGYHCDPDENLGGHHDHQNFAQWIQWLIVGGESGPRARPMQPRWARELRDFCSEMGVAFHFKQWGEWAPNAGSDEDMMRLGKKAAGRELDGATWNEFPAAHLVPA